MKTLSQWATAMVSGMVVSATALANEDETGWHLGAAAGYGYEKSLFKFDDDDSHGFFLPIIEYRGSWYSISLFELSADIYSVEEGDWGLEISTSFSPSYGQKRDENSSIFDGMDERKEASDITLSVDVTTPIGLVGADIAKDIGSAHEGQTASLYYQLPVYGSDNSALMLTTGIDYYSSDYVDYYYGVRTDEVNAQRQAYKGDRASSSYIGYIYQHQLTSHLSITHNLLYRSIPDEITDSPLTEKGEDTQLSTQLILAYEF